MADLRALMESLGFGDVRTLLNSGNVVFTASGSPPAKNALRIEQALAARLGVSARVTVISGDELRAATARKPFGKVADNPSRLLVAVLADPKDRGKLGPLTREEWTPEALALGPRVAYLWCPDGVIASRVAKALDRALGDGVTTRNWATMRKLRDLLDAG